MTISRIYCTIQDIVNQIDYIMVIEQIMIYLNKINELWRFHMVNIVKIRGSVFAPYALLKPIQDPATEECLNMPEMHVNLHHTL